MKKSQHVVPHNNTWAVRKSGSSKVTKTFKTKKAATEYGRKVSNKQNTELYIHNRNGKIASKDSHGHDPYPPKG